MKKLLLLFTAILFISCSADRQTDECDCVIEYYQYVPIVGGGGGNYVFQFSNPIEFDCSQPSGFYYPVSNINYNYAKINCD
jgi:hypothetical protein